MKRFPPFGKRLGNADQGCFLATKEIEGLQARSGELGKAVSPGVVCFSPGDLDSHPPRVSRSGQEVVFGLEGPHGSRSLSLSWATRVGEPFPIGVFPARLKDLFGGVLSERQILQVVKSDDVRLFVCWEYTVKTWLYQRMVIFFFLTEATTPL